MAENAVNPTAAALAAHDARPKRKFRVPHDAREFPGDPTELVMRPITVAEEKMASTAAERTGGDFGLEAIKHSLVSADGQPISWDNGGKEKFMEGLSPKVRQLVVKAYERIHLPNKEDVTSFLDSMEVVV